jgi:membrane dipeptidase
VLNSFFFKKKSGHQLGNSIGVLRQYHALGVRYVTLTHSCHNAFADSCGLLEDIEPYHGGLRQVRLLDKNFEVTAETIFL